MGRAEHQSSQGWEASQRQPGSTLCLCLIGKGFQKGTEQRLEAAEEFAAMPRCWGAERTTQAKGQRHQARHVGEEATSSPLRVEDKECVGGLRDEVGCWGEEAKSRKPKALGVYYTADWAPEMPEQGETWFTVNLGKFSTLSGHCGGWRKGEQSGGSFHPHNAPALSKLLSYMLLL